MATKSKDLENKALARGEDKTAAGQDDKQPIDPMAQEDPAVTAIESQREAGVELIIAHPIDAGRVGNANALNPGDQVTMPAHIATRMVQEGAARLK